jgi:hypothetical protein
MEGILSADSDIVGDVWIALSLLPVAVLVACFVTTRFFFIFLTFFFAVEGVLAALLEPLSLFLVVPTPAAPPRVTPCSDGGVVDVEGAVTADSSEVAGEEEDIQFIKGIFRSGLLISSGDAETQKETALMLGRHLDVRAMAAMAAVPMRRRVVM